MTRLGKQITILVVGWIKERSKPLLTILVTILLLFLAWILWETIRLDNLGFDKTLWDWMKLLLVPVVLAVGGALLNRSERKNEQEIAEKNRKEDRRIADERRNHATLEAYFDRMTELLLREEGLRESQEGDEVRSIARTRTLAVLRSLDGNRKGQVVQFLYESGLIGPKRVIVLLNGADLTGAALFEADLRGANLSEVYLHKASLFRADLSGANLSGANLVEANLGRADLRRANLEGANLTVASLAGADLREANLEGARVSGTLLARAKSYKGATLPDGTKHD